MKLLYCCVLVIAFALPVVAQRPGSGLVIARLEDLIEITKHVAENNASPKSQAEARPEINRLLVIAAFDFVQITRNAPSREAFLESIDRRLAQLDPLMVLPEDRVQVAEFYDELLEMVGVASSDGRLDEFARRPPKARPAPAPATAGMQAQAPPAPPLQPFPVPVASRQPPKTTVLPAGPPPPKTPAPKTAVRQ